MKPNFKNIDIQNFSVTSKSPETESTWLTPELIPVKPFYTKDDLAGMEHLNYAAGLPPYLRGPYSVMYAMQP